MVISDRFGTASNNKSLESEEKDHQQNESYLVQKAQDNTRPNNANCKNGLFLAWRIFGDHSRSSQCPAWRMSPIRSPENSSQEQWGSVESVYKHLELMYIMYTSQSIKINRLIYIHVMSCHAMSSQVDYACDLMCWVKYHREFEPGVYLLFDEGSDQTGKVVSNQITTVWSYFWVLNWHCRGKHCGWETTYTRT